MNLKKILIITSILIIMLSPLSLNVLQKNKISLATAEAYSIQSGGDNSGFLACEVSGYIPDIPCELTNFLQSIFVSGGNVIVGLSAFIMDTFLFHSLQSGSYSDSGFIEQGWEILRDLTNVLFIFSLLLIAFKMVLGQNDSDNKSRLIKTILIALTINFSLFVTYAIIDGANLLAYTFYNKIEQNEVTFNTESGNEDEAFKGKSVSLGIAKKINPQKILNGTAFSKPNLGQRIVLVLMAGVINGVLIYVFLSVSFLFLGRTIGLWISAVLAPLAFASITVPEMKNLKYVGFQKWFSSLLQMAFMAPVFLFFLYLAVQFMNVATISTGMAGQSSGSFITELLKIVIPMATIVVLIYTAKKVASSMAGDFAATISEWTGKIAGGALAAGSVVATGGMAAAGLATRGVAGAVGAFAKDGSKTAKRAKRWSERGRRAMSFKADVTKIPGFKQLAGEDATKVLGKVTGRSALGHLSSAKTAWQKGDAFGDESAAIGKEAVERAKAKAERDKDKAKTAADWQKDVDKVYQGQKDEKAKEKIEDQRDATKVNKDTGKPDSSPDGISFKEYAKEVKKAIGEASLVVEVDTKLTANPENKDLAAAPKPAGMSATDQQIKKGESRVQFEERAIKQYDKDIKKKQKEIKQEERVLAQANAAGNTALASYAEANIRAMEADVETYEQNKEEFEKVTTKKKAEKLVSQEKAYENQARENVAKEHIKDGDQKTADRIRQGKVKTDTTENVSSKK